MKWLRALALLLLLPSVALAGAGTDPPNTVTYTFQQGVLPTAAYAGCDDTYLSQDSTSTAHGAFGLLRMNSIASGFEKIPVIRFRFRTSEGVVGGIVDDNPDSVFVPQYAWVGLYKPTNSAGNPASALDRIAWMYRNLSDWVEAEATWLKPFTAATVWPGGGTADAQSLTTKLYRTGPAYGNENEADSTTLGPFWSADTLWNSVYSASGIAGGDYANVPGYPDGEIYIKQSGGTTNAWSMGWHFWDGTSTVIGVLRGRMKNNGWVITNSTSTFAIQQTYASSEYTGWKLRKPMLIIKGHYKLSGAAAPGGAVASAGSGDTGIGPQ